MIAAAGPAAAGVPVKTPAAQPGFRAALEQIVDDGVPGAIGLARHGDQVLIAASGTADIATGQPMAAADRVRVGSIIKTIVATVVLQLVAEHELRLSDSVARWLPGLVPDGRAITLRELLQHTSGIFDYFNDPSFVQAFKTDPTRTWQPRALIDIAVAHPPLFSPGTAFAYSNTDYILLGLIIQTATGQPLARELEDRIFAPFGMHHTSLPFADVIPPRPYAHGYLLNQPGAAGPVDITRVSPSIAWAAGGLPDRTRRRVRPGNHLPASALRHRMGPRRELPRLPQQRVHHTRRRPAGHHPDQRDRQHHDGAAERRPRRRPLSRPLRRPLTTSAPHRRARGRASGCLGPAIHRTGR